MERGEPSAAGNRLDRKTIERNRRTRFKDLCSDLVSLVPHHFLNPDKLDEIEHAAAYITFLKERIEELKRRKAASEAENGDVILNIRDFGSNLEVVLVSGKRKRLKMRQVILVLEQEGAEVVSVDISSIVNKIFCTIHAQVKISRLGVDTPRIRERIEELISLTHV